MPERGRLGQVLVVLGLVLDLFLQALKDADGGGKVVDPAGGTEGGLDDLLGRDQVVRKAVVQAALELEQVVDRFKELCVYRHVWML